MDYMPQFGQNVDQQMPQDDSMMQLELQRRLKFADALRQQEAPQGQMVSGHYVAPSWTQNLANLYGKYQAGQQEKDVMKQYGEAQTAKAQKYADLLGETDPVKFQQGLSQIPEFAPELVKNRLSMMGKEDTPIVAGPGSIGFNRKGEQIFAVPNKPEKPTAPVVRSMRVGNMDVTQQFDPEKNTWTEIARGNAFKPGNDGENKPPSGYRWGANGSLEAIKGGPADINNKPMKEVPPTARQAYSGNVASLNQIDAAIQAAEKAPDEYFGLKGGMGNTYMSRMYPDSVDVRQKITGVGAAKRHELSGSAVTPSENAATAPLLPQPTDDKATIIKKLKGLRDIYSSTNQAIAGSFGDEYKPLAQKSVVRTGTDKTTGRKVVQYSDGTTAYAD